MRRDWPRGAKPTSGPNRMSSIGDGPRSTDKMSVVQGRDVPIRPSVSGILFCTTDILSVAVGVAVWGGI
ncbi:MAG: hypothetical protein RLY70_4270 [Planctomycetota bacterium]